MLEKAAHAPVIVTSQLSSLMATAHPSWPLSCRCASTQARAHVSSCRDSSSPSPSPIYVTFKVLQLANALRKKVTRTHRTRQASSNKAVTSSTTPEDFCQGFEKYAAAEIDKYLGRKTRHPIGTKSGIKETTHSFPTVAAAGRQGEKGVDGYVLHDMTVNG